MTFSPTRREFVTGLAATVAASVASPAAAAAPVMPSRPLGKTGLRVPILEVGGTYRFNRRYVRCALDLGCTFFDTAASYVNGWSERTLGEAINALGVRKDVTVVTKGHPRSPDALEAAVGESLERLRFDAVDIYYLHNLRDVDAVTDPEWKRAADALKRKGRIRFFGFSCHNENVVPLLKEAARGGFIDVIMLKYNFRSYGDAELNAAIDAAHRAGIGLIAMKTQGSAVSFSERVNPFQEQGFSKHQAVLKAVWKDERLASAISAMPSINVLEQNVAAAADKLSAAEEARLRQFAEATRNAYCHGGCGGCHRECEAAIDGAYPIADVLRYLMYHDSYGWRRLAREKFNRLTSAHNRCDSIALQKAEAACPGCLPLTHLVVRAQRVLA